MYEYTNLSAALRDRGSPLRRYLEVRYPVTGPTQAQYRRQCGALLIDSTGADPATVGTAFDLAIRFALVPDHVPETALRGFGADAGAIQMVADLSRLATEAVRDPADDPELLCRACWALALCVDVYRRGLRSGSALDRLAGRKAITLKDMLALAPERGIREISEMFELSRERLLPRLVPPVTVGPEFDLSLWCNADADVIAGGTLVDLKTHLGSKHPRTGVRSSSLPRIELYQVISYALFDRSDRYRIASVGVYAARYGALVTWPLQELLRAVSNDPELDVDAERAAVWRAVAQLP